MAKYWYTYKIIDPSPPARIYTANYAYVKSLPIDCGEGIKRPCAVLATALSGLTPIVGLSHPAGNFLSANLQNYLTLANDAWTRWPLFPQPFVYLKV